MVNSFLTFFEHIKEMHIGFDWENAKRAEPNALAEKILKISKDKDLFIGICTKKEYVIDPLKVNHGGLFTKNLNGRNEDFIWKTSDWMIQEIGLCIGLRMKLLLLLEDGVRLPGGLQGTLEYIPFKRDSPEKAHNKILEMIKTMIPTSPAQKSLAEPISKSEELEKKTDEETPEWPQPNKDWTKKEFYVALLFAIRAGKTDEEEKIFLAYFSSTEGRKETNRAGWEAVREYFKILSGKEGSLGNLQDLAQKNPDDYEVQRLFAKGLAVYHQFERAAAIFSLSSNYAPSEKDKLARLGDAAIAFAKAGDINKSHGVINEMAKMAEGSGPMEIILSTIAEMADVEKEADLFLGSREALLELIPDDMDMRIGLAYKYSSTDQNALTLYHYERIPEEQRKGITWNNMGVAYDRLGLKSTAVAAFRKAEEFGSTLAMSNIAINFISGGFLPEAEEICQRATNIKDYDKEIGKRIYDMKILQEDESEKRETLLANTKVYREFYRDFGLGWGKQPLEIQSSSWDGPKCKLKLEIKGNVFKAEGSYTVTYKNSLVEALTGGPLLGKAIPATTKYVVRYKGTVVGLSGKCLMESESDHATILTRETNPNECLIIISEDLNRIRVYQKDAAEGESFYELKRTS